MKLLCREVKFKKNDKYYHIGYLSDIKNNKIVKNSNYIYEIDKGTYYLNIQYAIFDILTKKGIKYLDNIYNSFKERKEKKLTDLLEYYENCYTKNNISEAEYNYEIEKIEKEKKNILSIKKSNWEYYKDINIYDFDPDGYPELKKDPKIPIFEFNKLNNRTKKETSGKTTFYMDDGLGNDIPRDESYYNQIRKKGRKGNKRAEVDLSSEDLKKLYTQLKILDENKQINKNIDIITEYKISLNNEIELIHAFLDIIFMFDVPLNLVKCELCGKYFIREQGTQKRCGRIYKDGKTCRESYKNKDTISEEWKDILKLENSVKSFTYKRSQNKNYNNDGDGYDDFMRYNPEKKKKLTKKEYVLWLLSLYRDEDKKQKAIKRYHLQKYID